MKKKVALVITVLSFTVCAAITYVFWRPLHVLWELGGFSSPKEYIVLFQNNMELRATGGFLGSYGRIRLAKGRVSLLKIEDIYTPDGQLDGHVDPPWPIQAAFGQGWWKLRDSNWDPDFPTAAKNVAWFFERGKEPRADGIVAINLTFLENLLKITGPVYITDEPEKISASNFYKKTQAAVETGFFPGSAQKKNFMSKLGSAILDQTTRLSFVKKIELPFMVLHLLQQKQIFVFSESQNLQSWLRDLNFDGGLDVVGENEDYLSFFENNLGANKANCCIMRTVTMNINKENGKTSHELTIHYENTNPTMLKQPPQYWGGAYVNFMRIAVPLDAVIRNIQVGSIHYPIPSDEGTSQKDTLINLMKEQSDEQLRSLVVNDDPTHARVDIEKREQERIKIVSFFVIVDALGSNDVHVDYELPRQPRLLKIQKQSGIISFPFVLHTLSKEQKIDIARDEVLQYAK